MKRLTEIARSLRGPISTIPTADIRAAADVIEDVGYLLDALASGAFGADVREFVEEAMGETKKAVGSVPVRIPSPGYANNLVERLLGSEK